MKIALIPARGGSKRVPGKNIIDLGGYPLIWYSIRAAQISTEIDDVVVSSDSYKVLDYAESLGAKKLFRPEEISTDTSTDFDVLNHFYENYPACKLIIFLRPTTPFRKIDCINTAIFQFDQARKAWSDKPKALRSVHEMGESAYKCCELTFKYSFIKPINKYFINKPNQTAPKTYQPNGYIDIFEPTNLKAQSKIMGYETPEVTELDNYRDLDLLRWELEMRYGGSYVFK